MISQKIKIETMNVCIQYVFVCAQISSAADAINDAKNTERTTISNLHNLLS